MAAVAANPKSPVPLDTIPISPEGVASNNENTNNNVASQDGKPITVFHDANNFNVKHPLASTWTLWFTKPPSGKVSGRQIQHSTRSFGLAYTEFDRVTTGMTF